MYLFRSLVPDLCKVSFFWLDGLDDDLLYAGALHMSQSFLTRSDALAAAFDQALIWSRCDLICELQTPNVECCDLIRERQTPEVE